MGSLEASMVTSSVGGGCFSENSGFPCGAARCEPHMALGRPSPGGKGTPADAISWPTGLHAHLLRALADSTCGPSGERTHRSCGSSNFLEQLLTLIATTRMWRIPGITHFTQSWWFQRRARALSLEEGCGNAKLVSEDGLADRPRWTFTVRPGQPGPCEGLALCCDCVRSWCCPLLR